MTIFTETQRMTQWWLWAILLGTTGIVLGELVAETVARQLSLAEFVYSPELWSSALVLILVLVLFYLLRLTTEISSEEIRVIYFPMWRTRIPWHEVESAEIIKYGFVGYGIRFSFRYGTVYNAKGNWGLQIVKKNGGKILIGTQKPNELKAAVDKFL
ncbi:hypothetical protein [Salmonirosea aquatica]|uniref:Uncharacterized protein n=1 Tax=Salmonirosea aquatica TaxID=2654236 RepID=A0A7C9FAV2_9BACT|nr:hypothetical protein [Cytophagaceae bacterium SJW1-29]